MAEGAMRLTVIGSGTSQPQAETPASGLLVESESTALLVDCGQGVVRELLAVRDPRDLDAIVIGHMHADHYIDLVSLRYLLPWEGVAGAHVPVLLPPGGCVITDEAGARIAISGDTGPNEAFVTAARGADVVVAEATLTSAEFDDPRRGHLTPEEALDMADRAEAGQIVLVHFRAELRDRVDGVCAKRPGAVAGSPGLRVEVVAAHRWTDAVAPAAAPTL